MHRSEHLGRLALAARVSKTAGRIFWDRIEEGFGRALARTAQQLATRDAVNVLLQDYAPTRGALLPAVDHVALPGVTFESSNCTNFLITLDFGPGFANDPGLPRTAYVKIPCSQLTTRIFANAIGFWEVEAAFCERVAPRVPIRVPKVYAVARRGARFVLLLENLDDVAGTRMFTNRDMAAGTTIERARMCLRTFAKLHAEFWGWSHEQREALLPSRLHVYLAPGGRARTRALNAAAIAPAHRAAPDLFAANHVAVCRRAIEKWDALVDYWYGDSLTLIHGDSHLANCFEYQSPDGPQIGMIDFQGLQWCSGIRDVQYFLINSLEPDLLAAHEQQLIDFYLAELAIHGVRLDADDARTQYCGYSLQTLMVAVTSIGLGTLTERDATVRTVLSRSIAAIERLQFASWLENL